MKKGRTSGYYSDEDDSDEESRKKSRNDLAVKEVPTSKGKPSKEHLESNCAREEGWKQRFIMSGLDAYDRHKQLVNMYLLYYPGSTSILQRDRSRDKTDRDVIEENHRFLWDEDDTPDTWGKRLAKKYYDKLFKEYCISDLSRYKENKIAMRWRVEKELIDGKGQFICGNKVCDQRQDLRSWEVNFAYMEQQEKKNALVKLRLCPDCSDKLNFRHRRKEVTKEAKRKKSKLDSDLKEVGESSTSSQKSEDENKKEEKEEEKNVEDSSAWKEPAAPVIEQTRDLQFEEYLQDLLL